MDGWMSTVYNVQLKPTLAPNSTRLARFWTDLATSVRVRPAAEDGGSGGRDKGRRLYNVTLHAGVRCFFKNHANQLWCWTFWGWGWPDRWVLERQNRWGDKKNRWSHLYHKIQPVCSDSHVIDLKKEKCTLQLWSSWWCCWAISASQTFADSRRWTSTSCQSPQIHVDKISLFLSERHNSGTRCACVFLRWKNLCSHEDLLHQFRQDVEEMRQVQVHILILLQFRRVQLKGKQMYEVSKKCKMGWLKIQNNVPQVNLKQWTLLHPPPSLYLAGLFALHDLEDGVFESVVDKWCRRGLHVLLHQRAG